MLSIIAMASLAAIAYSKDVGITDWSTVRTTWNIVPLTGISGYFGMPQTARSAKKWGYQKLFGCTDGAPGEVYWKSGDFGTMPIYNADGLISGMMIGLDLPGKTVEDAPSDFAFTVYILPSGQGIWAVVGLNREPETICVAQSGGDTPSKVGDRLWIINGMGPGQYLKVPLTQSVDDDVDALHSAGFERGRCFPFMGVHWWKDMTPDMDCDDAFPIFLLYHPDSDHLVAWGIALAHNDRPDASMLSTKYWEHPYGESQLSFFFQPGDMPKCLAASSSDNKLSTMHVYLDSPTDIWCSPF